jgi:hypothetical protein
MFVTGCSNRVYNTNMKVATTVKDYKFFTKDEILKAAKKVFNLASDSNFKIDSYRDRLLISRIKADYKVLNMQMIEDRFEIKTVEYNDKIRAYLTLKRIDAVDKDEEEFFSKDLHEFFWQRIDYILNLRDTWPKCIDKYVNLTLNYNNVLCDIVDLQNKNPNKMDVTFKRLIYNDHNNSKIVKSNLINKPIEKPIENHNIEIVKFNSNGNILIEQGEAISDLKKDMLADKLNIKTKVEAKKDAIVKEINNLNIDRKIEIKDINNSNIKVIEN